MKKVHSFRLSEEAIEALKARAIEWGCSAGEAIERLTQGGLTLAKIEAATKMIAAAQDGLTEIPRVANPIIVRERQPLNSLHNTQPILRPSESREKR